MAKIAFIFSVLLFFPVFVFAENNPPVIINEIAWMGTINSANDEWIELFNNASDAINLNGWALKSPDEKIKIPLSGQLSASGFYLIERTDDNSAPNAAADIIYTGALPNSGIKLGLYDNFNNLIDEADCGAGWLAGNNETKQTMEREGGNWRSSQNPGGTPGAQNSEALIPAFPAAETSTDKQSPTSNETLNSKNEGVADEANNVKYPDGIFINEILPSPEGADETNEWVELFNSNDFIVNLSEWKVGDAEGSAIIYIFPPDTKIPANGYIIAKRPETKIVLNNERDGLNLIRPDEKIADSIYYENALKNLSYGKIGSEWQWSPPTPGKINITLASSSDKAALSEQNKSDNEKIGNSALATISESAKKSDVFIDKLSAGGTSPIILFLSALFAAIFSAAVMIIVKLKLKK